MFKRTLLALMLCGSSVHTFAAVSSPTRESALLTNEAAEAVVALLNFVKINTEVPAEVLFSHSIFTHLISRLIQNLYNQGSFSVSFTITEYGMISVQKQSLSPDVHHACSFLTSLLGCIRFEGESCGREAFLSCIDSLIKTLKSSKFSLEGSYKFIDKTCRFVSSEDVPARVSSPCGFEARGLLSQSPTQSPTR